MIFKVKNTEFEKEPFKTNLKYSSAKILKKDDEYTIIKVHKDDYFKFAHNLGGDTINNNRFEVIDYEPYDDAIFNIDIGHVHKPFRGIRQKDNPDCVKLDRIRKYLEEHNIDFRYIDYNNKTVGFYPVRDVRIIGEVVEATNVFWKSINSYRDGSVLHIK